MFQNNLKSSAEVTFSLRPLQLQPCLNRAVANFGKQHLQKTKNQAVTIKNEICLKTLVNIIHPPRAAARLKILHGFQQSQIALLTPHQDGAKQGRRYNDAIWSLVDRWAALP